MTDMMRDMIAQLMGSKREAEEGRTIVPYNHHSVCRGYLLHSCPAEILADSRLESLVTCRKLHEPAHRADFETEQAKQDHFYDIEAYDMLCQAVRTVDNEIAKIRDKIKKDSEDQEDSAEYVKTQKIFEVNEKIGKALARMEELGNEGKVEESMQLATQLEEMKKKKRELEADLRGGGNGSTQRLRVCEECGAQLNILDHESRLADHFGGKMHLGMVDIRERLEDMKKTIEERRTARREYETKNGNLLGDKRKSYDDRGDRRDDRRDRDRDRERDRDRRDKDKDRKRSRSRDRDRRNRSRSRERDRKSSSRRDSSRDRKRDRR